MDEVTPILPSPKLPRDFMQVVIIPFTFHWWWWWWRWNKRAGFRLVPLKFQFYRLQIDMSVPPHSEHDLVVCGGDRGQGGGHIRRPCDCTACHWYGSVVVAGLLSGRTICPTRGQSSTTLAAIVDGALIIPNSDELNLGTCVGWVPVCSYVSYSKQRSVVNRVAKYK